MRAVAISSLIAMTLAVTPAEAAKVRWEGFFFIKKATGTCTDYNPVRSRGTVKFEPELSGTDNGAGSSFSLFNNGGDSKAYRLQEGFGLFTKVFKNVDTMYTGFDFSPDDSAIVKARFKVQKPLTITTTTNFITIVAEIQNFDFMPGCTVSVDMALTRRIE